MYYSRPVMMSFAMTECFVVKLSENEQLKFY